jgi:hypothetical protein
LGSNALEGSYNGYGETIAGLDKVNAILDKAVADFNGDYVDAISNPVGWDMHTAAMDQIGTEAVASLSTSSSNILNNATWMNLFDNGTSVNSDGEAVVYTTQEYFAEIDKIANDYMNSGYRGSMDDYLNERVAAGEVPEWVLNWTPDVGWDNLGIALQESIGSINGDTVWYEDYVTGTSSLLDRRIWQLREGNADGEEYRTAGTWDASTNSYVGIMDSAFYNHGGESAEWDFAKYLYENPDAVNLENLDQAIIDYISS